MGRKHDLRRQEYKHIVSEIKRLIPKDQAGKSHILEFGCGPCSGAEHLCDLGHLTATDIYRDSRLSLPPGAEFQVADIHQTEFQDGQFDIVVSSQCLEHLENLDQAFSEMHRIGGPQAWYVFSVPTATWLVLSIPAKVFKKLENLWRRIWPSTIASGIKASSSAEDIAISEEKAGSERRPWYSKLGLGGHGCYPSFAGCFRAFRVNNWRRVLTSHGLSIVKERPLFLYGDSYLPLFPPNCIFARLGIGSSYLFVCRKRDY